MSWVAEEVGLAYVRIVPSMRGFSQAVSKDMAGSGLNSAADAAGKGFGQRFAKGAKVASAAVLASLAVVAKQGIDIASDTAEAQSKVGQVFGANAKDIESFAATSAKAWGISRREALAYTSAMGSVLVASGVNEKKAAKLSLTYTQLAADMASFNNTSVEEASAALQASLTGEFEMLKKYGVVINDARLEQEALAQGVKKSGATWTAAQKRQLSYSIVMRDTAKAQGDFSRTSGGLANQQKILAARTEDLKAKVGAGLLPATVKLVSAGNSAAEWAARNEKVLKPLVGTVAALAASVWVINGAVKAATATKKAWTAASKAAAATQRGLAAASSGAIRGISAAAGAAGRAAVATGRWAAATTVAAAKATASMVAAAARQAAAWAMIAARSMAAAARVAAAWLISMGPIAIVAAAVAGLVFVVVKNWDKIKAVITGAATAVINFIKARWPLLLAILAGPFGLAVLAITKHWDKIVAVAKGIPDKIKSALGSLGGLLVGKGEDLVRGMIQGITNGAGWLYAKIKEALVDKPIDLITHPWKIFSPSRLTMGFGENITKGMAIGITKGGSQLLAAQQELNDKLKAKIEQVRSIADEVKGAFKTDLSATQIDADGAAGASLLTRMDQQAAQAEKFAALIKRLRKGGLREDLVRQLVAEGPSSLASAQELAANIGLANKQAARITKAGKKLAASEVLAREGVILGGGKAGSVFTDSQLSTIGSTSGGGSAPAFQITIVADSKKFKEWIRGDVRAETGGDAQKYFGKRAS